jgi:hypothetical protein
MRLISWTLRSGSEQCPLPPSPSTHFVAGFSNQVGPSTNVKAGEEDGVIHDDHVCSSLTLIQMAKVIFSESS